MKTFDYEPVTNRSIQDLMIAELDDDLARGNLALSPRLTEHGRNNWKVMLYSALLEGTSESLALQLKMPGVLAEREASHTSKSGTKLVPKNAAWTLAQSTFNRYYIRAVCRHAARSRRLVEVYRARESAHERASSHEIEGQKMLPQIIERYFEDDPRRHDAGLPFGPNSGLSVRIAEPTGSAKAAAS
jgi:hypothetical protein